MNPPRGSGEVAARVDFGPIRYANCWEDSALLISALEPAPGKNILSIASAGDNSLHLLSKGARVVAADLSTAQLACLDLRRAAIVQLSDAEALAFLGFIPASTRLRTYASLRGALQTEHASFWDARPSLIANGIIHAGKFERYFRLFRRFILPLAHSRSTVRNLLQPREPDDRVVFYRKQWDTFRWRGFFRLFFSRAVMGRLGRDPEFFRHVEGRVADRILARTRDALTRLDPSSNPYLRYILTGSFEGARPDWTAPEVLDGIRRYAPQLVLHAGAIEEAASRHANGGFDGFNLSDIFEYLSPSATEELYRSLIAHARPPARLAYWNMLAPRACPPSLLDRVQPLTDLAATCFARDRAFFYSAFHIDEVRA